MKVLYFLHHHSFCGGLQRILIDKINYLAQSSFFEVHVAFYGNDNELKMFPFHDSVIRWLLNERPNLHVFQRVFCSYVDVKRLIGVVSPDIVVSAKSRLINLILPLMWKRVPKVTELHFSFEGVRNRDMLECENNHLIYLGRTFFRRFLYSRYDKFVVLVNDDLKAWKLKNMTVIPNFTNIPIRLSRFEERENMVINVGRLENQKDQQTLIEAWKIVNRHYPDWKLEIWGEGCLRECMQKQIEQSGLEENVSLKGMTKHIENEYPRASIFALSSKYEGMPLVCIEAMTAGIPCVSFDISGIRDVINDEEDGIIVPERSPEALAQGIMRLIEDAELRKSMSEASLRNVKKFDKDKIMSQWISLFDSLVKEKKQKKLRKHHFLFK